MGLGDLQTFIETQCQQACKSVDLVQEARLFGQQARACQRRGSHQLRLVVDAECCLNKLYGGFYADWTCGGQWNRMLGFLTKLVQTCRASNIELTVFFNGTLESQRMDDWYQVQLECYKRVQGVLRHVQIKGSPPAKALWLPPPMIRSCLRLALRQLGVTVACSMDDHHQEVIGYCRENDYSGLLAHDSDYAIFNPPRYFSAYHLKMTFKGTLETQEYIIDDLAKAVDLHPQRFCILAALLGTHILRDSELSQFYCSICHLSSPVQLLQFPSTEIIRAVIAFVRSLESIDDLDAIGATVFSGCPGNLNDKVNRFKQSIQYYVNGTKDGYLKYRPKFQVSPAARQPGSYPSVSKTKDALSDEQTKKSDVGKESALNEIFADEDTATGMNGTTSSSGYSSSSMLLQVDGAALLARRLAGVKLDDDANSRNGSSQPKIKSVTFNEMVVSQVNPAPAPTVPDTVESAKPQIKKPQSTVEVSTPCLSAKVSRPLSKSSLDVDRNLPNFVSADVMHIASERHQKGLMCPWVYQLLAQGEIKLSVSLEDDGYQELPVVVDLFRPLRQRVYAVLFNLSERISQWKDAQGTPDGKKKPKPTVSVKEWVFPTGGIEGHHNHHGRHSKCDTVSAEPLDWAVPGLQRLWLGTSTEAKSYRLKTFLSCMQCDSPQNMLINVAYVPQQFMLLCCVLRYILLYKNKRVLRPYELDVILATAVSPLLQEVDLVQDTTLPEIQNRGIHLASLLMNGVEHAMFVNDALGAPIPWGVACPWLFFDGKVFHMKLLQAGQRIPLLDLCDGNMEQVVCVEKMRTAILHGIDPKMVFSFPPPRPLMEWQPPMHHAPHMNMRHAPHMDMRHAPHVDMHSYRNNYPYHEGGYDSMDNAASISDLRGGMLEIAGVVVGSWGANTALAQNGYYGSRSLAIPPHVMSVGPHRGGKAMILTANGVRGQYNQKTSKVKKNKSKVENGTKKKQENVTKSGLTGTTVASSQTTSATPILHLMKNTHVGTSAENNVQNGVTVKSAQTENNKCSDEKITPDTDKASSNGVHFMTSGDKPSNNQCGDNAHAGDISTDRLEIKSCDEVQMSTDKRGEMFDRNATSTIHKSELHIGDVPDYALTSTEKNDPTSRDDMSTEKNTMSASITAASLSCE